MTYLDIVCYIKNEFYVLVTEPQISVKYATIKVSAEKRELNQDEVMLEGIMAFNHVRVNIITNYFDKEIVKLIS